jgi:hypothetical protein
MKLEEVPQDRKMIDGQLTEVCYAVDQKGRYTLASSAGWDPKNVANDQAWNLIKAEVEKTVARIKAGKLSPLAFHMVRHQMTVSLLASYVGLSRLRVWWHLKPAGFRRMKAPTRQRYAHALNMDLNELEKVPDNDVPFKGPYDQT